MRTLESGFEYRFPTIGNGHLNRQAQISPLLFPGEACEEFAHLMYVDPDISMEEQMKD